MADAFPDTEAFAGLVPIGLIGVISQHRLAEPWQAFANAILTRGTLPARLRELVVLRVAWVRRSAYVWGGHVIAARREGVSELDLERVMEGRLAPGLSRLEAALLEATDRMLDNDRIDSVTRATIERELGPHVLVELGMIVGQYVLVTSIVEAFRIAPEPGVVPLPPRRPLPGRPSTR
jgi:AhpD family alkylhydroperoxidase